MLTVNQLEDIENCLKATWAGQYPVIYRKAEILCCNTDWLVFLKDQLAQRDFASADLSSLKKVIALKKLLYDQKWIRFSEFLADSSSAKKKMILEHIISLFDISFENQSWQIGSRYRDVSTHFLAQELDRAIAIIKRKLTSLEQSTQTQGWTEEIQSIAYRFVTESSFFRLSQVLLETQNHLTESSYFKKVPILNVKLSAETLELAKFLMAFGQLAIELFLSRSFGWTLRLLQVMADSLLINKNYLLRLGALCGQDEITVINNIPMMKWCLGLSILLSLQAMSYGYDHMLALYSIGSYVVGSAAYSSVGLMLDYLSGFNTSANPTIIMLYGLTKFILQFIAYAKSQAYFPTVYRHVGRFFESTDTTMILEHPKTCLAYREACEAQAREVLGVSKAASWPEIRAQYKRQIRNLHPDHHQNQQVEYSDLLMKVQTAYERLDTLVMKKS